MQFVNDELPAGELEFVGQAVHSVFPVDGLYFPATQAVQMPPSGPVHPALQVQFVKAALPAVEVESDGQSMHPGCPVAFPYLPGHLHAASRAAAAQWPDRPSAPGDDDP